MIDFNLVNVTGWTLFPIVSGIIAWFTRQTLNKLSDIQEKVNKAITEDQVKDDIEALTAGMQKQLDDMKEQINMLLETILRKQQ